MIFLFLILSLIAIIMAFVNMMDNNMNESFVWVFASLFSAIAMNGVM